MSTCIKNPAKKWPGFELTIVHQTEIRSYRSFPMVSNIIVRGSNGFPLNTDLRMAGEHPLTNATPFSSSVTGA
jgi:hypothetical protein